MRFCTLTLIFFFSFLGCNETKEVIQTSGDMQLANAYVVTSILGQALENGNAIIIFNETDTAISGQTGCNSFFGSYTKNQYNLSFGEFAVSEKYCNEPLMIQERNFLEALRKTGAFIQRNGVLTLFSSVDKSVLLQAKNQKMISE